MMLLLWTNKIPGYTTIRDTGSTLPHLEYPTALYIRWRYAGPLGSVMSSPKGRKLEPPQAITCLGCIHSTQGQATS